MSTYIGIDPGQKGGLAKICQFGGPPRPWAEKMPATERDIWDVLNQIMEMAGNVFAYIEAVHSMPKQGLSSTFKFGRSYGFLRGCLVASEMPFDEVSPVKWQRAMGINPIKDEPITAKKNRHKAKAQQLFPSLEVTHAIADALLIAEFCRRIRTSNCGPSAEGVVENDGK